MNPKSRTPTDRRAASPTGIPRISHIPVRSRIPNASIAPNVTLRSSGANWKNCVFRRGACTRCRNAGQPSVASRVCCSNGRDSYHSRPAVSSPLARGRRVFDQRLTREDAFRFHVGGRVHFVGDENFLLVNAGQEYEFTTPAKSSLFNFTIFMSELEVADAWASIRSSEEACWMIPARAISRCRSFFVAPMTIAEPVREIRSQLRSAALAGSLSAAARSAAVTEIIDGAMRAQWEAMGQLRRVKACRPSTREETVRRMRRAIDFIESDLRQAARPSRAGESFLYGEVPFPSSLQGRHRRKSASIHLAETSSACG